MFIGMEAEIQLRKKKKKRFPDSSIFLVWGRASRHQKLAPIFPCQKVKKRQSLQGVLQYQLDGDLNHLSTTLCQVVMLNYNI